MTIKLCFFFYIYTLAGYTNIYLHTHKVFQTSLARKKATRNEHKIDLEHPIEVGHDESIKNKRIFNTLVLDAHGLSQAVVSPNCAPVYAVRHHASVLILHTARPVDLQQKSTRSWCRSSAISTNKARRGRAIENNPTRQILV